MKGKIETHYYRATGFTPYYFAHVTFNIVRQYQHFLRNVEDIFGDMSGQGLTRSFPKFSNLHVFIEATAMDLLYESYEYDDCERYLIMDFVEHVDKKKFVSDSSDIDAYYEAPLEEWFASSFEDFIEEIFHILFADVAFLQRFNWMTTGYLENWLEHEQGKYPASYLERPKIPQFVKDAIYFRDRGECRQCKVSIDRSISPFQKEHYDHIVPLSLFGSNDITNLQLLCPECNLKKSNKDIPASSIYQRAYRK